MAAVWLVPARGGCRGQAEVRKGEGAGERGQLRAVLPVGSRGLARELLDRFLSSTRASDAAAAASAPEEPTPVPDTRVGSHDAYVVATSGRFDE